MCSTLRAFLLLPHIRSQKKKVVLFDPAGDVITSLTIPDPSPDYLYDESADPPVLALAWHPSGSHLAVLPRGQSFAMVWSAEGGTARVDGGINASSAVGKVLHVFCCSHPACARLLCGSVAL